MFIDTKIGTVNFRGLNYTYQFDVYSVDTKFNDVGAVYIFSKRVFSNGQWYHTPLYIGQTESLHDRIPSHEKWPCVNLYGCNCICIHRDDNERSRLEKEADLLAVNSLPCNY